MIHYVKKVKGVKRDGQAKAFPKRAKNSRNFQGSYAREFSQPTLAAKTISFPCLPLWVTIHELYLTIFHLVRVLCMCWVIDHLVASLALIVGNLDI